ncbi:MAG TPA: carboxypeptidase regulatory-like domain-containing protein [Terriglobia bacterium]|nr:carboxypeptidase regulatory-like domain-containing protein [Terriglobia bacterium]
MKREFPSMQRSMCVAATVLLWVSAMLLTPRIARPQANSATFYGTVTDPTGAVVPGAKVTLIAQGTRATTTKVTGGSGDFAFSFVPVGTYTLRIEAKGFRTYVGTGIVLTAGQQTRQTFHLQLGSAVQTVSVTSSVPLVNTVSAQQLHTFQQTEVRQLPLLNRNIGSLMEVGAGVNYLSSGNAQGGVQMNGVGLQGTRYSLDGTNASGNLEGSAMSQWSSPNLIDIMSLEGVQEVSTVKGVIPAEYADAVGGQVNIVSKSGTNQWHGSVFENHQDSALNARFQRASTKPRLTFNQFGGALGGPIVKDRVFIFGDYEGYRRSASQFVEDNVPTQATRQLLLGAVPAYNLALQEYPLPNSPTTPDAMVGLFSETKRAIQTDNHVDVKGDIMVTPSSRFSLSFSRGSPYQLIPRIFLNDDRISTNPLYHGNVSFITGGAQWTSETRFGYNRPEQSRLDGYFALKDPNNSDESGFPFGRRLPNLDTTIGFSGPGGELWIETGYNYELEEKFALQRGHHSFKFGGDYQRTNGSRTNPQVPDVYYTSLEGLLTNTPSQAEASFGQGVFKGHLSEFGIFGQDDWRATPKLTVNLGLRYDFYYALQVDGTLQDPTAGVYNPSSLSMDGNFIVGPLRPLSSIYNNDNNNFGPRFGFAYNPDGQGKTAIRGGFGVMFTSQMPGAMWAGAQTDRNIPFRDFFTENQVAAAGLKYPIYNIDMANLENSLALQTGNQRVAAFTIFNPNLQNPYTMQYTLDVEHQLTPSVMFSSAFVGTRGVKFLAFRWGNQVRPDGTIPNPNLSRFYYVDNSQTLSYFGWQNSLKKRFSRNLSFDINYTYAKSLATQGGDVGAYYQNGVDNRNQNFFDLKADRGPAAADMTHYFIADWVYQLPGLSSLGNSFVRETIGGWQASGIFSANTGQPIYLSQPASNNGQRPDFIGGTPVLSNYTSTLQYLNPAAFARVPLSSTGGAAIRPGNAGPGEWRGPGQWDLDFSLAKNFSIRENVKLQIRTDMFNAFNHTNLSGLRTGITDPFFGKLLSTTGARVIQLNARLTF